MSTVIVESGKLEAAIRSLGWKVSRAELAKSADSRRFVPNPQRRRLKQWRAEARRRKDSKRGKN